MVPGKTHRFSTKHRNHDLQRLFEFLESISKRAEFVTERVVFELEPACADPQTCPTRRDVVKGSDRLCQKSGVPIGVARH